MRTEVLVLLVLAGLTFFVAIPEAMAASQPTPDLRLPLGLDKYAAAEAARAQELGHPLGIWETLKVRAEVEPFNLWAAGIFLLAVLHTFACGWFNKLAHRLEERHQRRLEAMGGRARSGKPPVSFAATVCHFFGEVEAVFGIWLVPLLLATVVFPTHGWGDALAYVDSRNFTEPVFVVVIMAIASTRPVLEFARGCLSVLARLGGSTPAAWWLAILTVAPLLGSFITEPAAMTIAALLLSRQFYALQPSMTLRYATLGLLFVNVSVGGTLTHFAAPPVLMVASSWHWNLPYMFTHFGWRAALGIVVAVGLYALVFRRELFTMGARRAAESSREQNGEPVPWWVIAVHLAFLAWTVVTLHHPTFFVFGFLFFLAFTHATRHHQYETSLRGPVMVGFFLASLVLHGGLQGWWISVLLASLSEQALFVVTTVLTAFNDNAAITYLATQVPAFDPDVLRGGMLVPKEGAELARAHALEYAVMAGAVTGGGLTVIANAPNPAGQSLLARHFGPEGISPLGLFLGAIVPTLIMAAAFMLIP